MNRSFLYIRDSLMAVVCLATEFVCARLITAGDTKAGLLQAVDYLMSFALCLLFVFVSGCFGISSGDVDKHKARALRECSWYSGLARASSLSTLIMSLFYSSSTWREGEGFSWLYMTCLCIGLWTYIEMTSGKVRSNRTERLRKLLIIIICLRVLVVSFYAFLSYAFLIET